MYGHPRSSPPGHHPDTEEKKAEKVPETVVSPPREGNNPEYADRDAGRAQEREAEHGGEEEGRGK